ncbi:MAG: hypothetical protein MI700_09820, partial [Balneolales bacterium]|nr:hypothetical protein [Balneolales bacterium]
MNHQLFQCFVLFILLSLLLYNCKDNPTNKNDNEEPTNAIIFPTVLDVEAEILDMESIKLSWNYDFSNASLDIVYNIEIQRNVNSNDFISIDTIQVGKEYIDRFKLKVDSTYSYALRFISSDSLGSFSYSNPLLVNLIEFPHIKYIYTEVIDSDNVKLSIYSNITDELLSDQQMKIEV